MTGPADTSLTADPDDRQVVLSRGHAVWLNRFVAKDAMVEVRRALRKQGWTIVPGTKHDKAYPPGVDPQRDGWPYVPLHSSIGEGRALANTIAQLRRTGPFRWKGR
jgi:hypothetical protein